MATATDDPEVVSFEAKLEQLRSIDPTLHAAIMLMIEAVAAGDTGILERFSKRWDRDETRGPRRSAAILRWTWRSHAGWRRHQRAA